ncbi:MAG: hypothetical protein ACK5RJ_05075 [Burkholderiales bacterium]|nr:hypothetical protein [Rhodocyclaceae bacterium]MCA3022121.1 hypothetical protein [Rhodocyclaceae bacterium]MCA3041963.1 hypothetical protein [Rhodocyclaceae bacterium]MCA3051979.1 hypothetical protein [Rhodocyclaceae bacterium]
MTEQHKGGGATLMPKTLGTLFWRYVSGDKVSLGIETRGVRDVFRVCFSECDD